MPDSNNVIDNAGALAEWIHDEISDIEDLNVTLVLDALASLRLTIVPDPEGTATEALVLSLTDPDQPAVQEKEADG